jgi:hypothetical protein
MPSQYVVLQYGNVMTGEYLNIAVYSYDMDEDKPKVYSKFLVNWTRINMAFGSSRESRDPIMEDLLDNWLKKIDTKEALFEAVKNADSPYSSLLFTKPRGSLLAAELLAEDMAKTFLVEAALST